MAEQVETEEQPTDEQQDEQSDTDWQAEADKWKALARKHEDRAKANAEAAEQLSQIEEAKKTEQQKLTERAEAAEQAAAAREGELLRLRVAMQHELPSDLAERLRGDTEEELVEDAKRLLDLVGAAKPKPAMTQGVQSGQPAQDGNAWFRQQFGPR